MLCVVSHPRSGTHLLCKYLFANFQTPYRDYFDLFATHHLNFDEAKGKFPKATVIHISRNIHAVLKSVFRMRERNGISQDFNDFSKFIRTRYCDMPRTTKERTEMRFNDKTTHELTKSWIGNQQMTPTELWLKANRYWYTHPQVISVEYEHLVQDAEEVILCLEECTNWKRPKEFKPIQKAVGWRPPDNEDFKMSKEDDAFLADIEGQFNESIS